MWLNQVGDGSAKRHRLIHIQQTDFGSVDSCHWENKGFAFSELGMLGDVCWLHLNTY